MTKSNWLQCIIDLKENVLRLGGGEVSVHFLQGWFFDFTVDVLLGLFSSLQIEHFYLMIEFLCDLRIIIFLSHFRKRHSISISR